ncbi:3-oxoacyl-[acyl-carrier protein] reductase, partial [hydrothermal vent metagenome]
TQELAGQLNKIHPKSCITVLADFNSEHGFQAIINAITTSFNRLDVLVNNASEFFPTKLTALTSNDYNKLFNSNVKGPLFLSKACYPLLKKSQGTIINLIDIHADKPLKDYPVYSMAKAANKMMVQALAKEFASDIRVNGISPGCIIWPKQNISAQQKNEILSRITMGKQGNVENIYQTVKFLIDNDYITGQTINVDGGRSLNL